MSKVQLPEYWLVKSGSDVTSNDWLTIIEFINDTSAITEDIKGELSSSYYGMMMGDIPVILDSCPEEFTLFTIDSLLNEINGSIEKVTTYDGQEVSINRVETLSDLSQYDGQYAVRSETVTAVNTQDEEGIVLYKEATPVTHLGYVLTSELDLFDNIHWSDYNNSYINTDSDDCYYGIYTSRGSEGYFISCDRVYSETDDTYFASSSIASDNDYIYSSSRGTWVSIDEYDDWDSERLQEQNAGYHSLTRKDKRTDNNGWSIGFEVEKEDCEACKIHYDSVYSNTRWCKESDSSLDCDGGYELVSPIFSLFDKSNTLEKDLEDNKLIELINADSSGNCGGHINVAHGKYNGEAVFEGLSGFFPLFYSMYEHRIDKSYSQAKKKHEYYRKDKYSAVFIKGNVCEFRIPSAYRNVKNLIWRRDLVQIMAKNFNKSELDVLKMMLTPKSDLFQHLRKVYTAEQLISKAESFIRYAEIYNNKVLPKIDERAKKKVKATEDGEAKNQQV